MVVFYLIDSSFLLKAANVGVGISGEEGLQAASASDYSISQFHFLRRLILVHGTWNFDRCVKVFSYFILIPL